MFHHPNIQAVLTNTSRFWTIVLAVIVLLTGFSVDSMAAPKSSVMAPLASKSLLLAGTAKGVLTVVGERGHILISKDNGDSWTQVRVPTRTMLMGVYFHDDQLGWAVGHEETILRTTVGGKNWEIVNHNYSTTSSLNRCLGKIPKAQRAALVHWN